MSDRVAASYLQQCLGGNRGLIDALSQAHLPPAFAAFYGRRLLPRPGFVAEAEVARCTADLRLLHHMLVELPDRLFNGDAELYRRAVGIASRPAALIWRFPEQPSLYGRADLYHDGRSLRLLEYNADSAIGGVERAEILRALMEVPAFRKFAEAHHLSYVHTGERVAETLRSAANLVTGGTDPVVALVEGDGTLRQYLTQARTTAEMMHRLGIKLLLGEVSQVSSRSGQLYLHDTPVDVVLRYFSAGEALASSDSVRAAERIFQAHETGKAVLWTTMRSLQVFNKGCLALLSDPRWRAACSADEKVLVDRFLPWTRMLTSGTTDVDGAEVDLIDYCRANRRELILKTRGGYGGDGIVAGWEATDHEWKEALAAGRSRDYVVQRRVVPRPEHVVDPASGKVGKWTAVWGCFVTPEGYAGMEVRALPYGDQAVVNVGAGAHISGAFSYPVTR